VAEGARLESVFRGNSNLGSNPSLSASILTISVIQDKSKRYKKVRSPCKSVDTPLWRFHQSIYPRVMVPSHVLTLAGIAVPVNHVEVTFLVSV
jgi:hypothetical protein